MSVAPTERATASASGTRSVTRTEAAPAARATAATRTPIGPAPVTRTSRPSTSPARWTACTATASGSVSAARTRSRPGGRAITWSAGTASRAAETALHVRHARGAAQVADLLAQVAAPGPAGPAAAADGGRVHGDRGALGQPGHRLGPRGDPAHHLVAQHHRGAQGEVAHPAVPPVVQVRAADAAVGDGHHGGGRAAGGRFPGRGRLDAQVLRPVGHAGEVDEVGVPGLGRCVEGAHRTVIIPPSTYTTWPLTKSEAGETRNSRAPTRSSGRPQRAAGVRPRTHESKAGSSCSGRVRSVTM